MPTNHWVFFSFLCEDGYMNSNNIKWWLMWSRYITRFYKYIFNIQIACHNFKAEIRTHTYIDKVEGNGYCFLKMITFCIWIRIWNSNAMSLCTHQRQFSMCVSKCILCGAFCSAFICIPHQYRLFFFRFNTACVCKYHFHRHNRIKFRYNSVLWCFDTCKHSIAI